MTLLARTDDGRLGALWRLVIPQCVFWTGFTIWNAMAPALPFVASARGLGRYLVEIGFYGSVLVWALIVFSLAWRRLERRRSADYGLDMSRRWLLSFCGGLALGAVLITLMFSIQYLLGWVRVEEGWRTEVLGVPLGLGLVLVAIKALIVASWEEIVFRAGLVPGLAEVLQSVRVPDVAAVALAVGLPAAMFGLAHLANPNATLSAALAISVAGAFTGFIYVRTGSLALPIGAHAAWNFFQAHVFGFPLSGQEVAKTSAIVISQGGPAVWTGGQAGPEAGLLCLLLIAGATGLIVRLVPPRGNWMRRQRA